VIGRGPRSAAREWTCERTRVLCEIRHAIFAVAANWRSTVTAHYSNAGPNIATCRRTDRVRQLAKASRCHVGIYHVTAVKSATRAAHYQHTADPALSQGAPEVMFVMNG